MSSAHGPSQASDQQQSFPLHAAAHGLEGPREGFDDERGLREEKQAAEDAEAAALKLETARLSKVRLDAAQDEALIQTQVWTPSPHPHAASHPCAHAGPTCLASLVTSALHP